MAISIQHPESHKFIRIYCFQDWYLLVSKRGLYLFDLSGKYVDCFKLSRGIWFWKGKRLLDVRIGKDCFWMLWSGGELYRGNIVSGKFVVDLQLSGIYTFDCLENEFNMIAVIEKTNILRDQVKLRLYRVDDSHHLKKFRRVMIIPVPLQRIQAIRIVPHRGEILIQTNQTCHIIDRNTGQLKYESNLATQKPYIPLTEQSVLNPIFSQLIDDYSLRQKGSFQNVYCYPLIIYRKKSHLVLYHIYSKVKTKLKIKARHVTWMKQGENTILLMLQRLQGVSSIVTWKIPPGDFYRRDLILSSKGAMFHQVCEYLSDDYQQEIIRNPQQRRYFIEKWDSELKELHLLTSEVYISQNNWKNAFEHFGFSGIHVGYILNIARLTYLKGFSFEVSDGHPKPSQKLLQKLNKPELLDIDIFPKFLRCIANLRKQLLSRWNFLLKQRKEHPENTELEEDPSSKLVDQLNLCENALIILYTRYFILSKDQNTFKKLIDLCANSKFADLTLFKYIDNQQDLFEILAIPTLKIFQNICDQKSLKIRLYFRLRKIHKKFENDDQLIKELALTIMQTLHSSSVPKRSCKHYIMQFIVQERSNYHVPRSIGILSKYTFRILELLFQIGISAHGEMDSLPVKLTDFLISKLPHTDVLDFLTGNLKGFHLNCKFQQTFFGRKIYLLYIQKLSQIHPQAKFQKDSAILLYSRRLVHIFKIAGKETQDQIFQELRHVMFYLDSIPSLESAVSHDLSGYSNLQMLKLEVLLAHENLDSMRLVKIVQNLGSDVTELKSLMKKIPERYLPTLISALPGNLPLTPSLTKFLIDIIERYRDQIVLQEYQISRLSRMHDFLAEQKEELL